MAILPLMAMQQHGVSNWAYGSILNYTFNSLSQQEIIVEKILMGDNTNLIHVTQTNLFNISFFFFG